VFDDVERDVWTIRLPRWGRVVEVDDAVPWAVVGEDGQIVEPIRRFLLDFIARGNRPGSVRSYAFVLLRWWRWLNAVGVPWDKATPAEARDLVLWLGHTTKLRQFKRTASAITAGTINRVTRKRELDDHYQPRTIRHNNAVVRSFYEFWIDRGQGPVINPVRLDRIRGRRPNAHHNPLDPFRAEGRLRYNPRLPKPTPRAMPDQRWQELFGRLRSNRDRALLSIAISNGARAAELLGVRNIDVDWGEQLIRVHRKGSGAPQWLPASTDSFVWLRLYLHDLGDPLQPEDPLWWTLRRRDHGEGLRRQLMTYEALRAVFRRVNTVLGANWTMHDLRHTAAIRMSRSDTLSLRDLQTILGHAHMSTTGDVYLVEDEAQVIQRVHQHLNEQHQRNKRPAAIAEGYDANALTVLLGDLL
jgi:integrase/recombinase XerD